MKSGGIICLVILVTVLPVYLQGSNSSPFKWNPSKWIDQEVNLEQDNGMTVGEYNIKIREELAKSQGEVHLLKQWVASIQEHVDTLLQVKENWKTCTQTVKEKDAEITRQINNKLALIRETFNTNNKTVEILTSRSEQYEVQIKTLQNELNTVVTKNKELTEQMKKKTEKLEAKEAEVSTLTHCLVSEANLKLDVEKLRSEKSESDNLLMAKTEEVVSCQENLKMAINKQQEPRLIVDTFRTLHKLKQDDTDTMLHACTKNRSDVVEALLDLGVDIHVRMGQSQWTCLHFATHNNYINLAKVLLKRGCNVDVRNSYLSTPLMEAGWYGHLELAQLFIDHGADLNARVQFNKQSVYLFVKNAGKLKGAEFLKSKGALAFQEPNVIVNKFRSDYNLSNDNSNTMLHACSRNHPDIVEALLDLGVDIHLRMEGAQWACLHYAAVRNYTNLAKLLLKRGCNVDVRNSYLSTPLMEAGWHERLELAQLFIDHGADLNARVSSGITAYLFVKNAGKLKGAEFLKSRGAQET